jgi:hypothetical protein
MPYPNHIIQNFRRMFEEEGLPFSVEEFLLYVQAHDYYEEPEYGLLRAQFIRKKRDDEYFANLTKQQEEQKEAAEAARKSEEQRKAKAEAEAKEEARREYPFSDEAFEQDWPQIRASLIAGGGRAARAATPRDYTDSQTWSESIKPSSSFGRVG